MKKEKHLKLSKQKNLHVKEKEALVKDELKLPLLNSVNFEVFERGTEETRVFKSSRWKGRNNW